jgi:hypothetical protein
LRERLDDLEADNFASATEAELKLSQERDKSLKRDLSDWLTEIEARTGIRREILLSDPRGEAEL